MLRIGMLTPRSTLYPSMTFDIMNGLKASFTHCNIANDITLFTDNIGFGIEDAEIYTKAERMLLGENADIVIACCDSRIAVMLQPMFTAAGKLLLVTNLGANLPESWQPEPTTINHSLNFTFNACLTGKKAAAYKTAALATSYYDAGYNQVYCMIKSFEQNGGSMQFNHVTHFKSEHFSVEPLQQHLLAENAAQSLLCLFSGDMAGSFYRQIDQLMQSEPAFFVSPMMLEESLAAELKEKVDLKNVQGYTPWLSILDNENNRQFIQACETNFGKRPNIFTLLGWDSGLLINAYAKQLTANNNNSAAAMRSMYNEPLPSPRGWIKLDPASHHVYGPGWAVNASGQFDLALEEAGNVDWDEEWKNFTNNNMFSLTELHSAWRNTYLCI